MDQGLQQRIGHNEAVFREVNEGISRGRWPGEEGTPIAFRCKCGELGCSRMIELPAPEYERIRASPRRFLVAPEHDIPETKSIVEAHERYVVWRSAAWPLAWPRRPIPGPNVRAPRRRAG